MDRMSPLDASFLHIEDAVSHMHIGSVAVFEGPRPAYEQFEAMVAGKLPAVPRYRQKVRFVPLQLGRPLWVDDPHFNLGYHLRHTALAPPGGDRQLRNLVGRVMSQQLDRHKPLWEMWMVEGLERRALGARVEGAPLHGRRRLRHRPARGDARLRTRARAAVARRAGSPSPSRATLRLVADALVDVVASPYEQLRAGALDHARARQALGQLGEFAQGMRAWTGVVRPTPPSSINGPIGPHRRWDWARTTLADVKTVRRALGGTVNDVVLTVLTRGFRDLLLSRDEDVDRPRRAHARAGVGAHRRRARHLQQPRVGDDRRAPRRHRRSASSASPRSARRWTASRIRSRRSRARCSRRCRGSRRRCCSSLGTRVAMRLPQRNINTVTTNVPGPQWQLYACGRPMLEAFPFVPLASSVRVGVAIFSYNGMLNYGVTGDFDTAPDIAVLVQRGRGRDDRAAQAGRDDAERLRIPIRSARVGSEPSGARAIRSAAVATRRARRSSSIAFRPMTARSAAVGWNVSTGVPARRTRATSRPSASRAKRRAG